MNTFDGGIGREVLPEGLYELLHTTDIESQLSLLDDFESIVEDVDPDDSPEVLSHHIAEAVRNALSAAKPEERVILANRLLSQLQTDNQVTPGPRQLLSLHRPDALKRRQLRRPTTKLSESALPNERQGRSEPRR